MVILNIYYANINVLHGSSNEGVLILLKLINAGERGTTSSFFKAIKTVFSLLGFFDSI
jgi:hypothetical protein